MRRLFPHLMRRPPAIALALLVAAALLSGCRQDMHDQPKYEINERSSFFADGRATRDQIVGTVARGHLDEDPAFFEGRSASGGFVDSLPVSADPSLLERGRERYNIFCSPCHDQVGNGAGMIVQRGYKAPPSLHSDRMRLMPPGYFYHVIQNGFGVMPAYRAQIPPRDRWAIIAYIGALQRSQHASLDDVPEVEREKLRSAHD